MPTKKAGPTFTFIVLLILAFSVPFVAKSQAGCTDPTANNYDPSATTNDASCTYNLTSYNPTVKVDPLNNTLAETSGLQMAGGFLWSFNDGGGQASIYRIDTITDAILQTVHLQGTTNVDWEDIAFDGTLFYIGDFGNNANGARTDLKIYKFPLSAIPDHATNPVVSIAADQIGIINFTYADQQQPPVATAVNSTKFDCEAMIVDAGKIHLFSKNWLEANTTHYVINSVQAGTYSASPIETFATNYLVTAADQVIGQELIVLLGYQPAGAGNHFMHLLSNYNSGLYFNGNKRRIYLPNASVMGQAEGITFRNNTYGYISNEKVTRSFGSITITLTPKLFSFNTANFSSAAVLPLQENNLKVEKSNGLNKITWRFNSVVESPEIQYSNNGTTFSTLQNLQTLDGVYHHQTSSPLNCYRLAWKNSNLPIQYSNTRCVNAEEKEIRNISLHKNGKLSFVIDNNDGANYTFTLLTIDGKLLGKTLSKSYSSGANSIYISTNNIAANAVVFLAIDSSKGKQTKLLKVERQ